jgi:aminoglycoside phosphotransferase (APT) family kinase protein
MYGRSLSDRVQRIPFGMYLRIGGRQWAGKHRAEFEALRLVNKHTRIPAPEPVDVLLHAGSSFLVMTRVPGQPIGQLLSTMTDEQVNNTVSTLCEYVAELQMIPNHTKSGAQICNSLGEGIQDWRIGASENQELKFDTEREFHRFLVHDLPTDAVEKAAKAHQIEHKVVFTHADLNPRNILADQDSRITGIVDWECAGWYPEYWEYTKAHFGVRYGIRWLADVIDQVFTGFREELYVENMLSDYTPF